MYLVKMSSLQTLKASNPLSPTTDISTVLQYSTMPRPKTSAPKHRVEYLQNSSEGTASFKVHRSLGTSAGWTALASEHIALAVTKWQSSGKCKFYNDCKKHSGCPTVNPTRDGEWPAKVSVYCVRGHKGDVNLQKQMAADIEKGIVEGLTHMEDPASTQGWNAIQSGSSFGG